MRLYAAFLLLSICISFINETIMMHLSYDYQLVIDNQIDIQFKKYLNMSFAILQQYEVLFPQIANTIKKLPTFYNQRLWNQLTVACLQLVYHPSAKGKISFAFYSEFVKRFQKNIDPTNLLKLIRQALVSLTRQQSIQFLNNFQKETTAEDTKILITAFKGYFSIPNNLQAASESINQVKAYIESHKDIDSYIYSSYYRLAYSYAAAKRKYKQFYISALQYLAYTQPEEIEEKEKLQLLFEMAVAVLVSDEIYNFSQLMQQPLLQSLKNSEHAWLYNLIDIFNKGDITRFAQVTLNHEELKKNASTLQQKIRLMAFLELAFNLPKNDRVVSFDKLSRSCGIPVEHVEFMVMKAMALKLVKGSIDQIRREITITWVAPKVLEKERIETMASKFNEWEDGVKRVQEMMKTIKV